MRAPSAPPFTKSSIDSFIPLITVNGFDVKLGIPNVGVEDLFTLNFALTFDQAKLFEMCAQLPSAILDCVLEIRSDNLKLRHVLHTERLLLDSVSPLTFTCRLPGQLFHAGAEVRICICATVPAPVDEFACNSTGGIIWESRIPLSRRSTAPALPIEFVDLVPNFSKTWIVEFNGITADALEAPATGTIRVFIANSTPLSDSLRADSSTDAFKLATRLIAIEVSIEAVLFVLSDDELLETIEECWENNPSWLSEEDSIGYFLVGRCMRAQGPNSLTSLRDQFRLDPNLVRHDLREAFVQW